MNPSKRGREGLHLSLFPTPLRHARPFNPPNCQYHFQGREEDEKEEKKKGGSHEPSGCIMYGV